MRFNKYASVLLTIGIVFAAGCSKKKDSKDPEPTPTAEPGAPNSPGTTAATGDTYVMTGTLAITGTALTTAGDWKVINYRLVSGTIVNETEYDVDDNGQFTVNISNDGVQKARLEAIVAGTTLSDADAEFLGALFGAETTEVVEFWNANNAEIKKEIQNFITSVETSGTASLLVAYQKSGDPVAEANSFKFIGFDASGRSVSALPMGKLKGNINMGDVTVNDSRTASSQLKADEVILATEGELEVIVSTSDLLKSAVNRHMNKVNRWAVYPFFNFTGPNGGFASVNGAFANLADYDYTGLGFYLQSRNATPFTFDDVCAVAEASRKEISLTPPATIKVREYSGTLYDSTRLTNKGGSGDASQGTQDGKRTCNISADNNTNGGFFTREDGTNQVRPEFGSGGSIVGTVDAAGNYTLPAGIWPLVYDGTTIGNFDLASSIPVRDGRPQAPALSFKVNTNSEGVVQSADVKVQFWNGNAYENATNEAVSLLKGFMKDIFLSAEKLDNSSTLRADCAWAADGSATLTCTPEGSFTFTGLKNVGMFYHLFDLTMAFSIFGNAN
jgi:hypothetical protein